MGTRLRLQDTVVDLLRGELVRNGRRIRLSTRELDLLTWLAARPSRLVTRAELLTEVWEHRPDSLSRAVDKTMNRLRAKVERDPAAPRHLLTVFGEGYRFEPIDQSRDRTTPGAPTNLPTKLDIFVGRTQDITALAERANAARLLTLTGPGGIGKSRLANQFSGLQASNGRFVGGVWWVEARAAQNPEDLVSTVARTLEIPIVDGADANARVTRALRSRGAILLVLDDLDSIADQVADVLTTWLVGAPELTLLVTSRTPTTAAGEHRFELGPLEPQDAASLFEARVRAGVGSLVQVGNPADFLRKTEGIPLAIELVAANVEILGPLNEITVDSVLGLSGATRPGARDATLRAALERSWAPLPPALREALVALGVFVDGFDIAAAVRILAPLAEKNAMEAIRALRDRSWVQATLLPATGGFRFSLFAIVREFVAAMAKEDRGLQRRFAEASVAHAEHYLELGERIQRVGAKASSPRLLRMLAIERNNIRTIITRSLDSAPRQAARAALIVHPSREGLESSDDELARLELALSQAERARDSELALRALLRLHAAQHQRRDVNACRTIRTRAVALARRRGDLESEAMAHVLAISAELRAGEFDIARGLAAAARSALDRLADESTVRVLLLDACAFMDGLLGDAAGAIAKGREACTLARRSRDRALLLRVLVGHAIELRIDGDAASARTCYLESLDLTRWLAEPSEEARVFGNLAVTLIELGDLSGAEAALRDSIAISRRIGSEVSTLTPLTNLGNLVRDQGRPGEADELYEQAEAIAQRWNRQTAAAFVQVNRGVLAWRCGRLEEAEARLRGALAVSENHIRRPRLSALFGIYVASLLADRGRPEEARQLIESAAPALTNDADLVALGVGRTWLALAEARRDDLDFEPIRRQLEMIPSAPDVQPVLKLLREAVG
jgi:predicted ATPase/DNA-binding winged helix-turn-helix (wHTH) protein